MCRLLAAIADRYVNCATADYTFTEAAMHIQQLPENSRPHFEFELVKLAVQSPYLVAAFDPSLDGPAHFAFQDFRSLERVGVLNA
jgi:hypothetical protein